jgi:hypothetical protein
MYMIRGCGFGGQLLILFNEPIDPVFWAFVVRHHFKDVGETEKCLLRLTVCNHLHGRGEGREGGGGRGREVGY